MLLADAALISVMDDAGLFCESHSAISSCGRGSETGFRETASGALFRTPLIHMMHDFRTSDQCNMYCERSREHITLTHSST